MTSVVEQRPDGKRLVAAAIGGVALLGLIFGSPLFLLGRDDIAYLTGPTMGTEYHLSVVQFWGKPRLDGLPQKVDAHLAEVNEWMSTYDPASELSRFNQSDTTDWFPVSPKTAQVAAYALELAKGSSGAYDPTVGPIVNLWGFGPGKRRATLPSDNEIAAAHKHVGWQLVEARLDPPALKKQDVGVYLDLSSVAKGFGVDEVSRVLLDEGVKNSMVEIGGEVFCRGVKPADLPWKIGVRKPKVMAGGASQSIVELRDEALATSGDYANFFEVDGTRFSHTIDPRTGRPVTHNTTSVSVRAPDCMTADALATTLLVMGSEAGYDWAVTHQIAALFIDRDGDTFREKPTLAWEAAIETAAKEAAEP